MRTEQKKWELSSETIILLVSIFLLNSGNITFFRLVLAAYPLSIARLLALTSLYLATGICFYILLSILGFRRLLKPVLITSLVLAAVIGHMTDTFGVVIDETMILNLMKTDVAEARDLLSSNFFLRVFILGALPSLLLLKVKIQTRPWRRDLFVRARTILVSLTAILVLVACFGKFYASFFREHKALRSYVNPIYAFYSAGKVASGFWADSSNKLIALGRDSVVPSSDKERELVIFVLGETARYDHFSLNGYKKKTNPLLEKEAVISFDNMWSCGTSTATSVPCMFSAFGRSGYTDRKGRSNENLLDMMQNTKRINILWRDNNSDSKGVALRVPYEDFKDPKNNPVCDDECRDEGMLAGLQEHIDSIPRNDIFIVLHQMGNHGPAYYRRYPAAFEKFKPACRTNQLEDCTQEEINNAYDNAILYTDYFLAKVIGMLKQNSKNFETVMIYVSDHGESLGESGIYLHGLPYIIAPDTQKRVGAFVWLGSSILDDIDPQKLKARSREKFSHDNIFHTLLGLLEVKTEVYRPELDILRID